MLVPDKKPLYELTLNKMEELIKTGVWKEGMKLPSEASLSKEFGISRATLREAMRIMEDEGLIAKQQGVGTFVRRKPIIRSGLEELFSVTALIKRQGMKPGTKDFTFYKLPALENEAEKLKLNPGDEIYKVERVRTADDIPVVYCVDRLPRKIVGDKFSGFEESVFAFLENEYNIKITYAVSSIKVVKHDFTIEKKLNIGKNGSVLLLEQIHYDENNMPILFSSNYFNADKFDFYIIRKRD
ncbi:GntR family transcriptional regulator [Thermoanaerobacterium thermosaccharolyticum]|uniref:GntR family transcriptional regulator n=1 Tax=Thermoanaerobacterium thermosaccharolyticum TaxID=1517 RepID=UPI0017808BA5|nr:GntR family transcriptional regulator [Thermoanaerobacterium thermosaccharolyticum]MBE0068194.1 GntR family transcriptional regulator [Thermoanaerobacterium thermosaccharolyticum]MBE0227969.1 GntR family transcriptional regulator [Thermoanaerobacterium thermosaccharolyticum]